ncbi:VQ motif-containing protein 25-like [Neltuma alba]|uniref:VQ motif-containing protein 25-like n=1 Tax=Neltuma alba TaxID=207710 RepID=UPI0010A57F67|nr:VQ motif-containing protein 25-like [Prosopis alba]
MEIKPRQQNSCMAVSNRPSLSTNKNSQAIAKTKPKIRIIHIFAPEIIKTDVGNFRELVQRLTGKPSAEKRGQKMPAAAAHQDATRSNAGGLTSDKPIKVGSKGLHDDYQSTVGERLVMKEEEEEEQVGVCREEASTGGYLGGFSDLEGFVSEFAQIPLLPLDDTHIHQAYEQLQL